MITNWRGDLVRALADTPEDQHDGISELMGFTREETRKEKVVTRETVPGHGTRAMVSRLDGDTRGMLIASRHLDCRREGEVVTLMSYVPGHGGDVWFCEHADGDVAAYGLRELDLEVERRSDSKKESITASDIADQIRDVTERIAAMIDRGIVDKDAAIICNVYGELVNICEMIQDPREACNDDGVHMWDADNVCRKCSVTRESVMEGDA